MLSFEFVVIFVMNICISYVHKVLSLCCLLKYNDSSKLFGILFERFDCLRTGLSLFTFLTFFLIFSPCYKLFWIIEYSLNILTLFNMLWLFHYILQFFESQYTYTYQHFWLFHHILLFLPFSSFLITSKIQPTRSGATDIKSPEWNRQRNRFLLSLNWKC